MFLKSSTFTSHEFTTWATAPSPRLEVSSNRFKNPPQTPFYHRVIFWDFCRPPRRCGMHFVLLGKNIRSGLYSSLKIYIPGDEKASIRDPTNLIPDPSRSPTPNQPTIYSWLTVPFNHHSKKGHLSESPATFVFFDLPPKLVISMTPSYFFQ